jgi:NAD+-dependent protein deacetylase SIR2
MIDLVFVIGTSLVVYPFAALPDYALPSVPRVLLNKEPVDNFERPNDVYIPGDCDESIWKLCEKLEWQADLKALHDEIGGVGGNWEIKKTTERETPATNKEPEVEDAITQLARELAEELRLDKEEDVEIRKIEQSLDKPDNKVLKSDT